MKNIVNFDAVRSIIASSMRNLEFSKAFGLAKKFFLDDDTSLRICRGEAKIKSDGSLDNCTDNEIAGVYAGILSNYTNVVIDESGFFYKLNSVDNVSFLSPDSINMIKNWGELVVQVSSIDAEKKRSIDDQTGRLYSCDAFFVCDDKIFFLSKFESPVDKRFTPFFSNVGSLVSNFNKTNR